MKTRRILSMLLTAALVLSSLPMGIAAAEPTLPSDVTANLVGTWSGTPVPLDTDVAGVGATENTYISIYDRSFVGSSAMYENSAVTLTEGNKYELTFWARTQASDMNSHNSSLFSKRDMNAAFWIFLGSGIAYDNNGNINYLGNVPYTVEENGTTFHMDMNRTADQPTGCSTKIYNKSIITNTDLTDVVLERVGLGNNAAFKLGTEWAQYKIVFVAPKTEALKLLFTGISYSEAILPIDIDGISLYRVVSETAGEYFKVGDDLIANGEDMKDTGNAGWSAVSSYWGYFSKNPGARTSYVTARTEKEYQHSDNGTLTLSGLTLEAGIYELSMDARLSEIDLDAYVTANTSGGHAWGDVYSTDVKNLSATLDGIDCGTAQVKNAWAKASFTLVLPRGASNGTLTLDLDADVALDADNFKLTKVGEYSDSYNAANGDFVAVVKEDNEIKEYLRVSDTQDNGKNVAAFGYVSDALTTEISKGTGTYELSFKMRADENAAGFSKPTVSLGSVYAGEVILSHEGEVTVDNISGFSGKSVTLNVTSIEGGIAPSAYNGKNGLAITDEWQNYKISFTISGTIPQISSYGIRFLNITQPVNIADLKMVRTDTDPDIALIGEDVEGAWYTDKVYVNSAKLEEIKLLDDYFSAAAIAGTDTTIVSTSDEVLPIGIYEMSGDFRSDVAAKLSAEANNVVSTSANVSTTWSKVRVTLPIKEATKLSDIVIALDASAKLDFANIIFTKVIDYSEDYLFDNGDPVIIMNENTPEGGNYVRATGNEDNGKDYYGFGYISDKLANAISTGSGSYELSMWLRSDAENTSAAAPDKTLLTLGTEFSSEFILTKLADDGDSVVVNSIDGPTDGDKLALSREWQKFTINFSLEGNVRNIFGKGIRFHNLTLPLDVAAISLVNKTTGETIIGGANEDGVYYTDTLYVDSASFETLIPDYYRAEGATSVDTVIVANNAEMLPMGVYTVSGMFRSDANSSLTASANGEVSESVALTDKWTVAELTLRLKRATRISDIKLALDSDATLDFADIIFTKSANYITDWTKTDGDPVVSIHEDTPEGGNYVRATGNEDNGKDYYGFGYISDKLAKAISTGSGSYELSMWLRSDAENTSAAAPDKTLITLGTEFSSEFILTKLADDGDSVVVNSIDGPTDGNKLVLSREWQKFTINFSLDGNVRNISGKGIRFHNLTLPLDVAAISLVNTETGEIIIGSEGENGSYYTDILYVDSASFEKFIPDYYRAEIEDSAAMGIRPTSTDVLERGLYHVSGKFRVGTDGAESILTANFGGTGIPTNAGAISVTLGDQWTELTFVIDLAADGLTIGDLTIELADAYNLDFADVTIEQLERYIDVADIDVGTLMTLLLLKKANNEGFDPVSPSTPDDTPRVEIPLEDMPLAEREGNLMADARTLKNWIIGDQTLSLERDADGSVYLAAGNITSNRTGFTYDPNVAMRKGFYRFTGEFRAANEGETTVIRITIGGKRMTIPLTNEWTAVELLFELDSRTAIEFTVKGGPVAWYTQDYDMRSLTLTDLSTDPIDVEITPYGHFDDPETALTGWRPAVGSGKVTHVVEDGNGFIRNTERELNYTGLYYLITNEAIKGATYEISYDIRTSNPGETMTARAHVLMGRENIDLIISEGASNSKGNEFEITNEWRHIESVLIAPAEGKLEFSVNGGQNATEDKKNYDVDNIKVVVKYGLRNDIYSAGDFEDASAALANWTTAGGSGTITHVIEDGNGFIRNSGRTINYHNIVLTTPIFVKAGDTVNISYDVRTSVKGETGVLRANVRLGDGEPFDLPILSGASNSYGDHYVVTNEWRHIEAVYTAEADGQIKFGICGGGSVEYTQAFDMDNLVIEIAE